MGDCRTKTDDTTKKSADNTLDLSEDAFVEYKYNQYNSEGVKNGSVNLSAYTFTPSDATIATAAIKPAVWSYLADPTTLKIRGEKKGTTTISVTETATG